MLEATYNFKRSLFEIYEVNLNTKEERTLLKGVKYIVDADKIRAALSSRNKHKPWRRFYFRVMVA